MHALLARATTRLTASAQLAHTGASSTTWLIAAGGVLLTAGGTAVWAGNRRRAARTHSS
ncbi:LAETG motif-containing sortase-dependent surface protein [Streptomyces goshikiensis]|uniref:LAETG motif-containing sortase-dependent surface protein n=1 Tax=Streptomyces goshikiensis TaxID=1942 RepID=UPI00366678D6